LRSASYDLRSASYDLRSASYDLRSASYDLRSASYEMSGVAFRPVRTDRSLGRTNVRFWTKAYIANCTADVRFRK